MIETLNLPTPERSKAFRDLGYKVDSEGRPLHPWIDERGQEFPDQTILWQWGENAAADAIILDADQPRVLLIQRQDSSWASAGGFIDADDQSKAAAAAREAHEETGAELEPKDALPVFEGIVNDSRASKYSWVTTAAFLWRTSLKLQNLLAGDDARALEPVGLTELRSMQLSGSHNVLIDEAIEKYGTLIEKLHYYQDDGEIIKTTGGHMSYERYINILPTGEPVFVKQYAPAMYTDKARAERSLLYLKKEANTYTHLASHDYRFIPKQAEYYDGTLAMDAYGPEDGWKWRAPSGATTTDYIKSALSAATSLAEIPIVTDEPDIKPSFISFTEEGWDAYGEVAATKIKTKLSEYIDQVQDRHLAKAAASLITGLSELRETANIAPIDQTMVMCHHDFRESNFAWHPEYGVKVVDWSWAGPGVQNSDTTTLLIDLHKRGIAVGDYMQYFNKDHALTMIGFWLMHSTWPGGTDDVRFQQVHSAVAAYDLLSSC